jgi:Tfp pilus assembly protein PilX
MIKHKRLRLKKKYRDILNRIGAILVIVLTIVALLYIRKINIENRIATNYDQSWHIERADDTNN